MSNTVSVEDVPLNRFHRLLTVRSGGGSFVDGYVLSIIGIAMMKVSPALGLTAFWEGLIAASALIGIFFGGFIGGALTDRLGRRCSISLARRCLWSAPWRNTGCRAARCCLPCAF